jgi:hypothetical protein
VLNLMDNDTSRPEAAFILLLFQATFWTMAGLSGLPFVLGGEVFMPLLAAASLALASVTCWMAVGLVRRRRRARRWTMVLESICLGASLLELALPLGANRGPVALLINVALPLAVILLLRGKKMRASFGITVAASR